MKGSAVTSTYDFAVADAAGERVSLDDYAGKVLLIVNVASKCGLTPQYEGLEALYREYRDRGLEILAFPSNQFKGQEPGTDAEIQDFCRTAYEVSFPVFAKIDVNGPEADPLYSWLRAEAPEGERSAETATFLTRVKDLIDDPAPDSVRWNFTKFLVGRDGAVIKRYEPPVTPDAIKADLARYL
jgi:glutathione peroxidase